MDILSRDSVSGETPLDRACRSRNVTALTFLARCGVDMTKVPKVLSSSLPPQIPQEVDEVCHLLMYSFISSIVI